MRATQTEEPRLSFSAFLLRSDQVQKFEAALITGKGGLELAPPLDGVFVPLPSNPAEPGWLDLVRRLLVAPGNLTLQSQSPGGLIFIRHAGKHFVLTFGHAWLKLEREWLEHDFGRRVALNSIARDKIVALRAEQVFARGHLSNERAPSASSVDEFGVEFDRDLVSAVEGLPADDLLGKSIRGATSLRTQLPLRGLAAALDRAADLFDSDDYKTTWPELDNIAPLNDSGLIAQLETEFDAEFASGTAQRKLNLFSPDQRREEGAVPDSYVFGRLTKTPASSPYLMLDSWLNYLRKEGLTASVMAAKQCRVHLMNEANEEIRAHSVFDCFGYELVSNGKQYVLSSGIWYEVVESFLRRINQDIGRIPAPMINLPTWDQIQSEGEYNEGCCRLAGFLHFDAKNIQFGGGQSKFEFCDIFHPGSKTLIFAKIASRSSGMSHLVEQVRRTAELLFSTDPAYRRELARVFRRYHPTADRRWLGTRPENSEWKLCLVSLGKPARRLPFFAKCGLVRLYRDLSERGHKVSFIDV